MAQGRAQAVFQVAGVARSRSSHICCCWPAAGPHFALLRVHMGTCCSVLTLGRVKQVSRQILAKYDKDNSGTLHKSEVTAALKEVMGGLGSFVPTGMALKQFDEDGSGDLDEKEFTKLVLSVLKKGNVNVQHLIDELEAEG